MTAIVLWKALTVLAGAPSTIVVVRWLLARVGSKARAEAKEADRRAKQMADLHAEIRAHRVTRDAEILALAVECAKLREDAQADRETAQHFELANVTQRGKIQRLTETVEARDATIAKLTAELADCRRYTRRSDPFLGG